MVHREIIENDSIKTPSIEKFGFENIIESSNSIRTLVIIEKRQ